MSCVELNDYFDYVINRDYHDGDDGNRDCDVSHTVTYMCTAVKMVTSKGTHVEKMLTFLRRAYHIISYLLAL